MNSLQSSSKKKSDEKVYKSKSVSSKNKNKNKNKKTLMKEIKQNNKIKMNEMKTNISLAKTKFGKIDFDEILNQCLGKRDILSESMNKNEKNKMNKEYENSFYEIEKFRKDITKSEIENIDTIVYHNENNDGMFAAAIAYHFYKELGKTNITCVPIKPTKTERLNQRNQSLYENKNVLLLDLNRSSNYLKQLEKITSNLIVIDDHVSSNAYLSPKIFVGTNHAACANTWKFFYPKEKIPSIIHMIDISDSKIHLGEYSKNKNLFTTFIGHRFTHNKLFLKKDPSEIMDILWDKIEHFNISASIIAGHYMDEVQESLKEQIAINAKPAKFQGYNVAVLNFNAPGIKKMVGRQINTNYERMGKPIDFAVVWGYEYTSNAYDITIIDNHKPESRIPLNTIAEKLGRMGGHPKGGGGHPHEGHFYWPRKPGQDIWDLFTKQYI